MTKQETIVARRILNNNSKYRAELRNPINVGDGYIITDGYRLIKTKENISMLEDDCKNPYETFVRKVLEEVSSNDGEKICAPTVAYLTNYIRICKENFGKDMIPHYQIVDGVWVNAYYLRDILTVLKKSVIVFSSSIDRATKQIYFTSPNGQGVLCPVRHTN